MSKEENIVNGNEDRVRRRKKRGRENRAVRKPQRKA